jgi:hypothetical protein
MFISLKRLDNNHQIMFHVDHIRYFEQVVEGANEGEHAMINGEIEVVQTYEQIKTAIGKQRCSNT